MSFGQPMVCLEDKCADAAQIAARLGGPIVHL